MSNNIAKLRISYERSALNREDLLNNPLEMFQRWLDDAISADILEPNAMTIATSTPDGIPSARVVLLKGVDHGFRFFTNYEGHKAQELTANPNAALVFYWDMLHRQVRIVGRVEKLTAEESVAYYHSRPRSSQIGAWTSPQSTQIPSRDFLEAREAQFVEQFANTDKLPLPPFWGGYRVIPHTVEFWQGRKSRLHDRFRYVRQPNGSWEINRLAP